MALKSFVYRKIHNFKATTMAVSASPVPISLPIYSMQLIWLDAGNFLPI